MQSFQIQPKEDNTTDIFTVCRMCGTEKIVNAPTVEVFLWLTRGYLIQNTLPSLSASDHELLISGTCDSCWKGLFSDDN